MTTDIVPIMSKADLLHRALQAQASFNRASGQTTTWTHKRSELAGSWWNLERIEGPRDFGNGQTLTLVLTDADGIQYVCPASCETGQWKGLADQDVIDFVNAGGRPLIRWDLTPSRNGQEYYALGIDWTPNRDGE